MFNIDEKIDRILFDFLGLILPGIVALFVLFVPVYFYDFTQSTNALRNYDGLVAIFTVLMSYMKRINSNNIISISVVTVLLAYIFGHILKVMSKFLYDFLEAIFDKTFNRLFLFIYHLICELLQQTFRWVSKKIRLPESFEKPIADQFSVWIKPFRSIIIQVFTFRTENYYADNKELESQTVKLINKRLKTNFPECWHTLYKFANVLYVHEQINTLSTSYLAKYNLYRSLSLVFFVNFFYLCLFFNSGIHYLPSFIAHIKGICLFANVFFWVTFHIKFKRYWTLCGNETLLSLFYYLNKNEIACSQDTNEKTKNDER